MTFDERYPTTYNEQPSTSTSQHHGGQFFTALQSASLSRLSLPGTSENLPTIGRLDVPDALGISLNGESQYEHPIYGTIPLPPLTPTPASSSVSRLSLLGTSENLLTFPFGWLDAPGALGISMSGEDQYVREHPDIYGTIPLPPVSPMPGSTPVSNNQDELAFMVPPQAMHPGTEDSFPVIGNSTSCPSGPPAQGIAYQIPQYLQLVGNLKLENPISIRRFLSILQYCSHLEVLSIMINRDDVTHACGFSARLAAENLIDLSIVTTVESKLLLDTFMAPNLKILYLEWKSQENRDAIPNNADIGIDLFLMESKCYLNTLSLVNLFPDEVQLVSCLKLDVSAKLQALAICNSSFLTILSRCSGRVVTEMTLQTLSQMNGDVPLCPWLSRLEITSCCALDGALISMVQARNMQKGQTFKLYYSFGAGEGHPIDRSGLAELSRNHNFTITEGPQYCIALD
ncbi:hypothetical protein C0989_004742 [Termitomyces sp. Mn162]|nr:hypothetical protein C0989_004742 [Termitomyces sp. Mn162]